MVRGDEHAPGHEDREHGQHGQSGAGQAGAVPDRERPEQRDGGGQREQRAFALRQRCSPEEERGAGQHGCLAGVQPPCERDHAERDEECERDVG